MSRVLSSRHSVLCVLGHAALAVFGFLLTLFGIALCATFWLLPVGLPLGLLGAAFMGAAGERPQVKLGSHPASVVLGPEEAVRKPVLLSDYETEKGVGALDPAHVQDQEPVLV